MGPVEAITTCLRRSFRFSGRASHAEIWWYILFACAAFLLIQKGARLLQFRLENGREVILFVCLCVPFLSALARRMHDLNLPGYLSALLLFWPFLLAIPAMFLSADGFLGVGILMIGFYYLAPVTLLILFIVMSLPGNPGPNRYGPNPLEVTP